MDRHFRQTTVWPHAFAATIIFEENELISGQMSSLRVMKARKYNYFSKDKFERMLYAVRCLKSNEDMILALAGQFKQLSHEPEKFR